MRIIYLSNGYETQVSDIDYDFLIQWKWNCNGGETGGHYVRRSDGRKTIYMHRLITNCPRGYKVDHKDRDELNNQRSNLRITTQSFNLANREFSNPTGYRGVIHRTRGSWAARIGWQGTLEHLGSFPDPRLAAHAYDKRAVELFGEFAWLNFEENRPVVQHDVNVSREVEIPFFA